MKTYLILIFSLFFVSASKLNATSHPSRSDFKRIEGLKYPNSTDEGDIPVLSEAFVGDSDTLGGFTELLPYILRSPNQEDAGSCLYMANTGMAEWWLARLNPNVSRAYDGPIDLSERYLMNFAGIDEDLNGTINWKLDTITLFNKAGNRSVLNRNYRFTKGWHTTNSKGGLIKSKAGQVNAEYTTSYNWINDAKNIQSGFVKLPAFTRDVLFADPASNQWNVGIAPLNIAETIKAKLLEKQAPVQVIYNHFGYWHAVFILGFDDDASLGSPCPFVEKSRKNFAKKVSDLTDQLAKELDPIKQDSLRKKILKTRTIGTDLDAAYKRGGGCAQKGVFYVRDSIYSDDNDPDLYDYDTTQKGDESPYSKAVILHEYEWVKYLANHVTQIYIK